MQLDRPYIFQITHCQSLSQLSKDQPAVDDGVEGDVMLIKLPVMGGVDVDEISDEFQRSSRISLFVRA